MSPQKIISNKSVPERKSQFSDILNSDKKINKQPVIEKFQNYDPTKTRTTTEKPTQKK